VNYEQYFVAVKNRVINDLGDAFSSATLDHLSLALNYKKYTRNDANDQYRAQAAKVPAYYNPNTHVVHLNVPVLERASESLIENIYYHELVHATSNHCRMSYRGKRVLKSGLKIQSWDLEDNQTTLYRGLNEGLTQYFANTYTVGGPAYKSEVEIIGKLVKRIGMKELRQAYFDTGIEALDRKIGAVLGEGFLAELSDLVDAKEFEAAHALFER
jgi:hypothetical protein